MPTGIHGRASLCEHDMEDLNGYFASVSNDDTYRTPVSIKACCNIKITVNEVEKHFQDLSKTAAGPCGIPFWVYKHSSKKLAYVVTLIFQECLVSQVFPSLFKRELITPLAKKKSPTSVQDYRPIAVTDILARVFERIILCRYMPNIMKFCPLSQHGFRRGRSTVTALIDLHSKILKAINDTGSGFVVAIDLTKAFDTIKHNAVIANAIKMEIDPTLVNMLSDFLTNRTRAVCVGSKMSSWRTVNKGVGQGTVQGPLVFLIATAFLRFNIPYVSYADDTTFIFDGNSSSEQINLFICDVAIQYADLGLQLNANKTKILPVNVKHCGQLALETVEQTKILGVVLDRHFKVSAHVSDQIKAASSSVYALQRLGRKLCLSVTDTEYLFKSVILSKLLYGVEFWWSMAAKKDKALISALIKRATRYRLVRDNLDLNKIVLYRRLALFRRLLGVSLFSAFFPLSESLVDATLYPKS